MSRFKLQLSLIILLSSTLVQASQNEWNCRGSSEEDIAALEKLDFGDIRYDGPINGFYVPEKFCDITRDLFNRQVCEASGFTLKANILKKSFLLTPQGEKIFVRCKMLRQ